MAGIEEQEADLRPEADLGPIKSLSDLTKDKKPDAVQVEEFVKGEAKISWVR